MNIEFLDSNSSRPLAEPDGDLLDELRRRARIRLNALLRGDADTVAYARWIARRRRWPLPEGWKLHHALNIVSTELDFHDWEHARRVLGGHTRPGDDMGGFWYDCSCQVRLNHWFARYDEAVAFIEKEPSYWLFPFRKQFVAGSAGYVRAVGLDPDDSTITDGLRNVHEIYGSAHWRSLCAMRLAATRARPLMMRRFS
jgi:hypothetical protein